MFYLDLTRSNNCINGIIRHLTRHILRLLCFVCSGITYAGQEAQHFGVCLTDSMNGKERKNLAKWIFLAMSSHSIIKPYSNASEKDIDASNKYFFGYLKFGYLKYGYLKDGRECLIQNK